MPIYEYVCENEHVTELLVGLGVLGPQPCKECGLSAERLEVYHILPFTESGVKIGRINDVPYNQRRINMSKFKEASAEVDYAYDKVEKETGQPLKGPSYYQIGKAKARAIAAGKAPPPKERF